MPGNKEKYGILFALLILPVLWAALVAAPFLSDGLIGIVEGLIAGMENPLALAWTDNSLKSIGLFLALYALGLAIYYSTRRNTRMREEHGSASWGKPQALNAKYADKSHGEQNVILTQNVRIGLDGYKHRRNLNVLVIGGSGAGKTRFYAKPNLLQANTSFVCLDPKGENLRDTGGFLRQQGYEIRVLDLMDMQRSDCYNPFHYLHDEADVLKLVNNIIRSTTPKGAASQDPFWERAEQALLESLMLFLLSAPKNEQCFPMVMELLRAAEVRENDETYESILDELFARLAMRDPESLAVKQYQIFKLAGGKTEKSILISLGVRLEKMNLPQLARIMGGACDMDLSSLGERKVALFICIPDNDTSLNFIASMLYTQLFQELFLLADRKHGGRLPQPVHILMDEFSNVALPNDFDKILSVARSRRVHFTIILQNLAQLKALYDKQWESIVGNADEFLYLGGMEQSTHEYVSKLLGKATLDMNTYSQSKGRSGNYTKNMQLTGRELLTPDEVRLLDNRYALLFIRGEKAVCDLKYDICAHPNYKHMPESSGVVYVHGTAPLCVALREVYHMGGADDFMLLTHEEFEVLLNESEESI
ncbi:type IV secretory system conjugative DNA transfer family protein [Christensenellaceae bacterium OttesenSCG-928-M15]|nr:type IV secretory system conjugative DNA transfer family protein [Christensenellaceae bacterium OttesenSCG-928-M15]